MSLATGARRRYAPRLPPEERRTQLLDAALDIALAEGFHAVTVDGVARAAGVTRPVVYGLFADRTQILAALLDRAVHAALAALGPVLPDVPASGDRVDPHALLVTGLTTYLTAVRDDPRTWQVILLPPEGAPAELAELITTGRRLVLRQLRALMQWGLQARGGPGDLDVDLFARSVQALAEDAARLLLAQPERYPVERFVEFTRALLAGLRRAPSPSGD